MSKEIAKQEEPRGLVIQEVDRKQLAKFLDLFGAKDIPQDEREKFVEICIINQLNPFKREAYITSYGQGDRKQFSFITGYEVYIKRAELSGRLNGWGVTTIGSVKDNSLKAIITIHRKDFSYPFVHEVYYYEYVQRTREGYPNKFWAEKPVTMIKKVAISHGFRLCFNEILGGLPYTSEELYETELIEPQNVEYVEIKEEPKPKIECTVGILKSMLKTIDLTKFDKITEKYEFTEDFLAKLNLHIDILTKLQTNELSIFEAIQIPEWASAELKEYAKECYQKLIDTKE